LEILLARLTRAVPGVPAVVAVGALYAMVGIVFAWPTSHARAWRLAAWIVSIAAYAGHVAYERLRLRSSAFPGAFRVALGVALGAFGLAVGAIAHSMAVGTTSEHRRLLLIALAVWPGMTALPAFMVAWIAGRLLPPPS
jgi:hypothetical protein